MKEVRLLLTLDNPVFCKAPVSYHLLLEGSFLLCCLIGLLVAFILCYLFYYLKRATRKKALEDLFGDMISEIIICEQSEELPAVMNQPYVQQIIRGPLSKPFGRRVLLTQLVNIHRTISGRGSDNIRWLYEFLELNRDSFALLVSAKWHRRATAIQQLAEMGQTRHLTRIYKATNSKNKWIRKEAQVAIVKMTGFKGLRFLGVLSHPLTQWQQLCLLRELAMEGEYETEKIKGWLKAENASVQEFALRLIKRYSIMELHEEVAACLQHPLRTIRMQALETIREIATEETPAILQQTFEGKSAEEQVLVVCLLTEIATPEQTRFFQRLVHHEDVRVKALAAAVLKPVGAPEKIYQIPSGKLRNVDVA